MSSTVAIENTALREKLLAILRKGIPEEIVSDIEMFMYKSGKAFDIASKVDNILDQTPQDKVLFAPIEWAVAYVIAHEQKTLEELIEAYESSLIKHKHNCKLLNYIKSTLYNLNNLINEFVGQIKEIRNENIYDNVVNNLERSSLIIKYLVDVLDKIEKENKELLEAACVSKENIQRTIVGIIDKM